MASLVTEAREIAIVRLSALGDVTLMLPVVETLKRAMPQARVTWIVGAGAYPLVEGLPGVEFLVFDKRRGMRAYFDLRRRLRGRRFDVLLAMQASWRANFIYPLISAPVKIGFDRSRARDGQWLFVDRRIAFARQHLLDSFFAFIEYLGVHDKVLTWNLPIGESDRQWARSVIPLNGKPVFVAHVGASKPERDWPVERFTDVIRAAQRRWGVHVVLTGGSSRREREAGRRITAAVASDVTDLVGRTTAKQFAAVLAQVDCLLAPDTGAVHIAVAVGTPVVGLYAVAPPQLSGPYLCSQLVVNRFPEAVRKILGRDPQTVPWTLRVHRGDPMRLIEVDDVLAKLAQVFDRRDRVIPAIKRHTPR